MAPRKQMKQAAAESTLAAADGKVSSPKKKKTVTKSMAVTAVPKQLRRVKEHEVITAFSPKNLRSRGKKNDTKDDSKKILINNADEKVIERGVEKKARGGDKSTAVKKTGTKTATAKPKAKAPVAKKQKDKVEKDSENGVVNEENPKEEPKKTTRRRKAIDEEQAVASAALKVQVIKKSKHAEIKITEADNVPEENNAEMIVASKKPRKRVKKTGKNNDTEAEKTTGSEIKEKEEAEMNEQMLQKRDVTESKKIKNTKNANAKTAMNEKTEAKKRQKKGQMVTTSVNEGKETKNVAAKHETSQMTLALESSDENDVQDVSVVESNNISQEENNEVEDITAIEDVQLKPDSSSDNLERPSTFLCFD